MAASNECPKRKVHELPTLHELDFIKGNGKQVRIFDKIGSRWDKIATRLHFDGSMIAQIQTDSQDTSQACRSTFIKWLDGKEGLRKPRTWNTVIQVLTEADLGQLADDLKHTLLSGSSISDTKFSSTMSSEDFQDFLTKEGLMESDYKKLCDNGIGPKVLTDLTEEEIDKPEFGFSFGGQKTLKRVITQIKTSDIPSSMPQVSNDQQIVPISSTSPLASATLGLNAHFKIHPSLNMHLWLNLTVNDLNQVHAFVQNVRSKWYNFGLKLGLSPDDLDSIKSQCHDNPEDCLREALKIFLERDQPKPSWKLVFDALHS